MSDDSVQQRIYGPVEKDLDKVVEELLSQSDRIPENTTGIEDRLKHVLSTPGKRIRPAITLLVAGLWGKTTTDTVVKMATAIELLHIATLVHDDTVDKADTRRGHATASNLWGRNIAVLLGLGKLLGRGRESGGVHITEGHNIFSRHTFEISSATASNTDNTNVQFFIGPQHSAYERKRQRGCG